VKFPVFDFFTGSTAWVREPLSTLPQALKGRNSVRGCTRTVAEAEAAAFITPLQGGRTGCGVTFTTQAAERVKQSLGKHKVSRKGAKDAKDAKEIREFRSASLCGLCVKLLVCSGD
jgi:hypothetical protein